jgi:hypothetical protein
MTNTINICNATHTTLGEVFVTSIGKSQEHKNMFDLLIEGEGRNAVFVTGTKEDLMRVASAMARAVRQIS